MRVTSFPEVRIGKETEIGLIQVIIHSFIEHINICDTSYMRVCSLQPALQVDNAGVSQLGAPACGIVYKCSKLPGCLWACLLDGRNREDAKSVHLVSGA